MMGKLWFVFFVGVFSGIYAMEAPPAVVVKTEVTETPPAALQEAPKKILLRDQWLKKPRPSDGEYAKICGIANDNVLYTYNGNILAIWQMMPSAIVEEDAANFFKELKGFPPSFLTLLPIEIFKEVYKGTIAYSGPDQIVIPYQNKDPRTYRREAIKKLPGVPDSVHIDSQGHIYAAFGREGKIYIFQKKDKLDPFLLVCVSKLDCADYQSELQLFVAENEGLLFMVHQRDWVSYLSIWKMKKPGDLKSYQQIGRYDHPMKCAKICVSPSGTIFSWSNDDGVLVWRRTNPEDASTYKDAVKVKWPHRITSFCLGPDDAFFTVSQVEGLTLWKMADPQDSGTYASFPLEDDVDVVHSNFYRYCAYDKNNKLLVSTEAGRIQVWQMARPDDIASIECTTPALDLGSPVDGQLLFDANGHLYVPTSGGLKIAKFQGPWFTLLNTDVSGADAQWAQKEAKKIEDLANMFASIKALRTVKEVKEAQEKSKTYWLREIKEHTEAFNLKAEKKNAFYQKVKKETDAVIKAAHERYATATSTCNAAGETQNDAGTAERLAALEGIKEETEATIQRATDRLAQAGISIDRANKKYHAQAKEMRGYSESMFKEYSKRLQEIESQPSFLVS